MAQRYEYAKRAATAAGIGFTELDNGFATAEEPAGLQQLFDALGSDVIGLSLTDTGRSGSYWWDIALLQVEAPAPSCSPRRDTFAGSSSRCVPTTSTSVARIGFTNRSLRAR